MQDISATGITLLVKASNTFSQGFPVTQFADDADPFDLPAIEVAATAMNVNGELVTWSSPQPIATTINVIPGGEDDTNLAILLENNRAAMGKITARDVITIVAVYPDGSTVTASNGKITSGSPGKSVATAGRLKSKAYTFVFQDISVTFGNRV